jgi:hypothetical protein
MPVTDIDHPDKVTDDGKNNEDCVGGHNENPLFSFFFTACPPVSGHKRIIIKIPEVSIDRPGFFD